VRPLIPNRVPSWLLGLLLSFLLMAGLPGDAFAGDISRSGNDPDEADFCVVVEHLRVQVPADARAAWLKAERATWEPWLKGQAGFLHRELLWDGEKEEGILLIHWSSRSLWHAIPQAEIDAVQRQFETVARRLLGRTSPNGLDINPFPLVYSGELLSVVPTASHPPPEVQ
jgi:uncharacterized protein (TIGR03792 family)